MISLEKLALIQWNRKIRKFQSIKVAVATYEMDPNAKAVMIGQLRVHFCARAN